MKFAPQTNFCFARGCAVRLYKDELSPGGNVQLAGPTVCHIGQRDFCEEHAMDAIEVERSLPLAIQELHALALLYPDAFNKLPTADSQRFLIARAIERVTELRALESILKGGV